MRNKDKVKIEVLRLYTIFKNLEKEYNKEDIENIEQTIEQFMTVIENTVVRLDKIIILMREK